MKKKIPLKIFLCVSYVCVWKNAFDVVVAEFCKKAKKIVPKYMAITCHDTSSVRNYKNISPKQNGNLLH